MTRDYDYYQKRLVLDESSWRVLWSYERPRDDFRTQYSYKNYTNNYAGKEAGQIKKKEGYSDYRSIKVNGVHIQSHIAVWLLYYGEYPRGVIDHIDGDGLNNDVRNLRDVTMLENSKNRKMDKRNSSGYNGVSFVERRGKYRARAGAGGKDIALGWYDHIDDAIEARKNFDIKNGFSKRHGKTKDV